MEKIKEITEKLVGLMGYGGSEAEVGQESLGGESQLGSAEEDLGTPTGKSV